MPNRNMISENYRFGYQGQFAEKDEETGWNALESSMWDARLGRWMAMDPAGQYASSYMGMGNNPVNGFDPDGEWLFFKNKKSADRAASNTNNIFKAKFGIDNAVNVEMKNYKDSYYKNLWDRIIGRKSYETKTGYFLIANKNIDASLLSRDDKFIVNSFIDVLSAPTLILADIVKHNTPANNFMTVGESVGFTFNSRHIAIPSNLPDYNSKKTNFNIGSQLLHEVLWHISPAGETLLKLGHNSNWLYLKTGGKIGSSHGVGNNQNLVLPKRKY
jgi:RHS repeat-associated protein